MSKVEEWLALPGGLGLESLLPYTSLKGSLSMSVIAAARRIIEKAERVICRLEDSAWRPEDVYNRDGLRSVHNHEFMDDPRFRKAYARGVAAAGDLSWHWRVHIGLWAAYSASKLDGDFIECGVNRGFLSSAIMEYLDWDSTRKTFYLLDTFVGLDARYINEEEVKSGKLQHGAEFLATGVYVQEVESVKRNFAQWKNVRLIQGAVPETLAEVDTQKIAYMHLDMNCAPPEVAAFNYLWDRLVTGAFILLDDYAFRGYRSQKVAMDAAADAKGVRIVSLPTGQGLLIKPPGFSEQVNVSMGSA